MKDNIAAPKDLWLKTPFANLIRYVPSGVYFSRIRVRGKLIRRSLKTNKLAVAKLRLGDLEKTERQRVEVQGAVENGNVRFGDALKIFQGRLNNDAALKPRTKEFRKERIATLLKSWPGLEQTEVRKIGFRSHEFASRRVRLLCKSQQQTLTIYLKHPRLENPRLEF